MQQRTLRKTLSVLLTLVMLLSMLPTAALATEADVSAETLPVVEEAAAVETTEEAPAQESEEAAVEETVIEETPVAEEAPAEETPVVEETPVAVEETVVEEAPVAEEIPVVTEEVAAEPVAELAAVEEEAVLAEITDTSVAAIGDQGYDTLNAAITDALTPLAEGDVTIELLKDATLTEAVEINHGTSTTLTIKIADSVTGPVTVAVSSNAQLDINGSSVVIEGKSATENIVFDGTEQAFDTGRLLYVRKSADVTLNYVTAQNLTTAATNSGGVIRLEAATLTINNSTFDSNTGTAGGVIYTSESAGTLIIDNCKFTGNTATVSGGAGAIQGRTSATVEVSNCKFSENSTTAGSYGNVLRIYDGTWTFDNCEFTKNVNQGRATIYVGTGSSSATTQTQDVTIKDCTFTNNGSTYSGNGGEIYCYRNATITLQGTVKMSGFDAPNQTLYSIYNNRTDCKVVLDGCTAELEGIRTSDIVTYPSVTITVLNVTKAASKLTLTNVPQAYRFTIDGYDVNYTYTATIDGEDADMTDGVFETAEGSENMVVEVSATKNETSYVASANGVGYTSIDAALEAVGTPSEDTAIYLLGNDTFAEAKTYNIPSNVWFVVQGDVTVTGNVTFDGGNSAESEVVRAKSLFVVDGGNLTLKGVSTDAPMVIQNFNGTQAGAAINNTGDLTVQYAEIKNNSTTQNSGAINNTGSGAVVISDSKITGNKSGGYGGAIRAQDTVSLTMSNVTVTGNHAKNATGSAISLRGVTYFENCTITGNTSDSSTSSAWGQVHLYATAELTLSANNNIERINTSSCSIALDTAVTGSVEIHNTDFAQYAEGGTALLTSATDGIVAASVGAFKMTDESYGVLDTGYVAQYAAKYDGTKYGTITSAIEAAETAGGVVTVLTSTTEEELMVYPGITLDLNGKTVTAETAAAFTDAHIIDSSADKTGFLSVAKESITLSMTNAALPIWIEELDTDGVTVTKQGFAFEQFSIINTTYSSANGTYTYIFRPEFSTTELETLIGTDGAAAHGLTVKALLSWDDVTSYTAEQPCVYTDDMTKQVYGEDKAFYAYVTNYANYIDKNLQICAVIESDTGVTVTSDLRTLE